MLRRLLASVAALVAVPVGVEWLFAYIKNEQYRLDRAAVVLSVVMVALVLAWTMRSLTRRLSLLLELALAVLGLAITVTGVLSLVVRAEQRTGLSIVAVCLGLTISVIAASAVYAGRTGDKEVADLCRSRMSADDLHFVGYYIDGICRFHLDVFENPMLNRFFRGHGHNQRRLDYERAGRQLNWIMSRLNIYLRRLDGGILIRTVLDVESGAMYYYWIDQNVYLTGLTLDQSKVLIVDEKLRRLANAVGHLPRGGSYPGERVQQVVTQDG